MEVEGIKYGAVTRNRQWERRYAGNPGANLIDAKQLAAELAKGRVEGRGR
jgi:hypothetical protein